MPACLLIILPGTDAPAQEVRRVDPPAGGVLRSLSLDRPGTERGLAAKLSFTKIEQGFADSDHAMLADLVAEQGVTIVLSPDPERDSHYSPSQAYYFFRNLFQTSRTESFRFSRLQDGAGGGRIHGVADWRYRRSGTDDIAGERLIITITETESGWGLAEIRAIR